MFSVANIGMIASKPVILLLIFKSCTVKVSISTNKIMTKMKMHLLLLVKCTEPGTWQCNFITLFISLCVQFSLLLCFITSRWENKFRGKGCEERGEVWPVCFGQHAGAQACRLVAKYPMYRTTEEINNWVFILKQSFLVGLTNGWMDGWMDLQCYRNF